jgi:hypothetical protein
MIEQPVWAAAGDNRRPQVVAGVTDTVFQDQSRTDIVHDVPEIGMARCRFFREGRVPFSALDETCHVGQANW